MIELTHTIITVPKHALDAEAHIRNGLKPFVEENKHIIDNGCMIRVALVHRVNKKRSSAVTNETALQTLLSASGKDVITYTEGDIILNFRQNLFTNKKKPFHLTAQEKLMLYKKIFMQAENIPYYAQIVGNLRKRLGKDFLAGVI